MGGAHVIGDDTKTIDHPEGLQTHFPAPGFRRAERSATTAPEIVAWARNVAIVRLPERRYPGVWVPGDTLSTWLEWLEEARSEATTEPLNELRIQLVAGVRACVQVVTDAGEPVPFAQVPPFDGS